MLKRIFLVAFFIPLAFVFPLTASVQETTRIASIVSLWPEYDQPGVLVQYQGKRADTEQKRLPEDVAFLVPTGVGVTAACAIQSDGQHTSETWKEADADDGITRVTYKAALPVDEPAFDVQHPLKATDVAVFVPDAARQSTQKMSFAPTVGPSASPQLIRNKVSEAT